ncbi:hypothetical protein KAJ27_01910 [bacterium]|nr:hypothetical protein [bacterium]
MPFTSVNITKDNVDKFSNKISFGFDILSEIKGENVKKYLILTKSGDYKFNIICYDKVNKNDSIGIRLLSIPIKVLKQTMFSIL